MKDFVDGNFEYKFYIFDLARSSLVAKICNYRPSGRNRTCDSGGAL